MAKTSPKRRSAKASRRSPVTAKARAKTSRSTANTRKPVAAKPLHTVRFANETAAYRSARNALLKAEVDLRRQIERVAALRRKLPLGGAVSEDYVFDEGGRDLADMQTVRQVRLSELFGDKSTLVAYSFMFGPKMANACPSCTCILDSLNGQAGHIGQRVGFVVIAKSPIERIREFARSRRWSSLRLLSSAKNTYNRDYRGETAEGSQMPSLNVFNRRNGKIHHFFNTELLFGPRDPGQDHRHVDMIWPLWNIFDFTPEGRDNDWYPKLSYGG